MIPGVMDAPAHPAPLPGQAGLSQNPQTLQVQPARMSQHHLQALGSEPPFSDTTTPSSFVTSVS